MEWAALSISVLAFGASLIALRYSRAANAIARRANDFAESHTWVVTSRTNERSQVVFQLRSIGEREVTDVHVQFGVDPNALTVAPTRWTSVPPGGSVESAFTANVLDLGWSSVQHPETWYVRVTWTDPLGARQAKRIPLPFPGKER